MFFNTNLVSYKLVLNGIYVVFKISNIQILSNSYD